MDCFKKPEQNDVERYEELRRKNLEDNKIMLAKLMSDVAGHLTVKPVIPPKRKKSSKFTDTDGVIRRNPSRSARYAPGRFDLPHTRSRSGSVSSSISSASSSSTSTPLSTPEKLVVKFGFFRKLSSSETSLSDGPIITNNDEALEDDDDFPLPHQTRKPRTRHEVTSVDDITETDLDMVAVVVSDKRYDSIYGTTCHQCRQKTNDMKTICRSTNCAGVRGQFCGPCLRNRYGEDAKAALKDPDWICPPCRGICNCSFCRRKKGHSSTGILIHIAREKGYPDVNSYLHGCKKDS
ncbi:cell division cycle-associated 7-like protein isoform X2 [Physella acuta]|uniref:cell division cycle-associated 7-like protein isoform X2 n=1 Tax=Physella acuta TaxID=109671 RepID=UPI0027DCA1B5|nr:cell division cycle-associated 7-like protein isoform X2 [Physella acuta]